jgi:uncharacterized membrane protein YeaQ/YmgE (transglycosylase-associated protein family)
MSLGSFLLLLLIAGCVGSIGAALVKVSGYGCVLSIIIGFIGAFVGSLLANALHLPEPFNLDIGGYSFPLLWSILGSVLVVAMLSLITRRYYHL